MDKIETNTKFQKTIEVYLYELFTIMCLVIPTGLNRIKAIILLLIIILLFLKRKMIITTKNIVFISLLMVVSLAYALFGKLNDAPGALSSLKVYIVYPIIYLLLYFLLKQKSQNINVEKILKISLILILVDMFIYIFYSYGLLPFYLNLPNNTYGINKVDFEVSIKSMGSLAFLIPYYISKIYYKKSYKNIKTLLFLILLIVVPLVMGRDILWIVLFLTFFLLAFITIKEKKGWKKILIFFVITILALFIILYFSPLLSILYDRIIVKLNSSERFGQAVAIWNCFLERPFFGYGMGSTVPGVIRSEIQPWAFEYVYLKNLYDFGIIGTIFYLIILFIPIFIGYKQKKKKNTVYPLIIGYLMILVANASNPYFAKLDYLNLYLLIFFEINNCNKK